MFGFLKDKLKNAVARFNKRIEEEGKDVEVEETLEEKKPTPPKTERPIKEKAPQEKKPTKEEKPKKEESPPKEKEKKEVEKKEPAPEPEVEKKGFFQKIKDTFAKKHEEEPTKEPAEKVKKVEAEPPIEAKKEKHTIEEKEETRQKTQPVSRPSEPKKIPEEKKEKVQEEEKKKERHEEKKETPKLPLSKKESAPEKVVHVPKETARPAAKPLPAEHHEIKPVLEKAKPAERIETQKKEAKEEVEEKAEEEVKEEPEKKGFFAAIREKVTKKVISSQQFEDIFWDLEIALLENNVAVEVIDKIKEDLKKELVGTPISRSHIPETIQQSLKESIDGLFTVKTFDFIARVKQKRPCVILFVGINGSGKTTTISKMVRLLQNNGLSCVIAAADTFRAAAIDQLEIHAENLQVKLIKHDYGADAAAVAFDAIQYANAKKIDVVLIDTAGRLHSNTNLMDELRKVRRVSNPDLTLFIGEAITGNDCVEQANEAIGIDGIILAKADIDEKGGAAISVSYVTKRPILYMGVGQGYDDLRPFDPKLVLESIGLEE